MTNQDIPRRIGEMGDEEARLTILRAVIEATGDVPVDAERKPGGGYVVTLHLPPEAAGSIPCAAIVRALDGGDVVDVPCLRLATDNIHRRDDECDDKEAHRRALPFTNHHPFLIAVCDDE